MAAEVKVTEDLREAALRYHREPTPGKIGIAPSKRLINQRDLSLAYSPGVAAACEAITENAATAAEVTARANLVAVVTNGSAVLGLGNIGPLAAKPVMEGKAVLFKKFAGIDVFDLEIDAAEVDRFVDIVAALEPTFGGINLEDIKAPECFAIEEKLRERMSIPVLHDDQHGTAIIVAAAIRNGLHLVGKDLHKVKLVTSGAGAAALACVKLLHTMGLPRENITLTDIDGVVHSGRTAMNPYIEAFAQNTSARTLRGAVTGADIFLGLSAPGVLTGDMVKQMADKPLILALANPTPEIMPEEVHAARDDAIVATGRSDYPNQVNNVLCFPFIFRGALDVGATQINEAMKIACVNAIADLARREESDIGAGAYQAEPTRFSANYLIPRPFDPRLITAVAPAVARAAMDSGVASRPIEDFQAYEARLSQFVFRSGLVMKPLFTRARTEPKRIVYAEGEARAVLHAVQTVLDEGVAKPILIGRPDVVENRIDRYGLRFRIGGDVELVDPQDDPRYRAYWSLYHEIMGRHGVSPDEARNVVRASPTVIASLMLKRGEADAMICGTEGRYHRHLRHVIDIVGRRPGVRHVSALSTLILPRGTYFMVDTHVTPEPTAEEIAEMTLLAAEEVKRFGIVPKIALLSHSNFGSSDQPSAKKMRAAMRLLGEQSDLMVEGEMHADAALIPALRDELLPDNRLDGEANVFVMPCLDSANISFYLLRSLGEGVAVGPILIGAAKPAYILTPSVTSRGILNMSAFAAVRAQHASAGE